MMPLKCQKYHYLESRLSQDFGLSSCKTAGCLANVNKQVSAEQYVIICDGQGSEHMPFLSTALGVHFRVHYIMLTLCRHQAIIMVTPCIG